MPKNKDFSTIFLILRLNSYKRFISIKSLKKNQARISAGLISVNSKILRLKFSYGTDCTNQSQSELD